MNTVDQIFSVLGGATAIATGTGNSLSTVHDWKRKGRGIPPWRRGEVLALAQRMNKLDSFAPETIAYLTSQERAPESAAA